MRAAERWSNLVLTPARARSDKGLPSSSWWATKTVQHSRARFRRAQAAALPRMAVSTLGGKVLSKDEVRQLD